jgi:16S rRNA (cytosine967-C5)-methyltransferase
MSTDRARATALAVLRAVRERDAYVNLELPRLLGERGLSARDAAFATELTAGTIRRQGTYDAVLAACLTRPIARTDPDLLDILRLGCHQLLVLRTPPHAAVSTSVALARQARGQGAARLANAVLRRVATRELDDWLASVAPDASTDPDLHLAVMHSHPLWIVRAFRDALAGHGFPSTGEPADAALVALLAADNVAPGVTLVARPGLSSVDDLHAAGARPGRWSPYAAVLSSGDPGALAVVRDGRAGVQDEGSQLVALLVAAAPVDGRDEHWLDLCAGPGGKAALLGALAAVRGARVVANEVAPHRAALVRRTVAPLGEAVEVRIGDGRAVGEAQPAGYDRVLVDAPCTGLGALRRRPEARWRRQPSDLEALGRLQRELLTAAVDATRPGGVVAYATCSPHLAETQAVVSDVLAARPDAAPLDAPSLLPDIPGQRAPYLQLWPHLHGTDAMFVALLRRT